MPPKGKGAPAKRGKTAKGQKHEASGKFAEEQKDIPTAFVLCHPLDCSMDPVSAELPPCLFPLCNAPVILYTLNWLSVNGISLIYLLCRSEHVHHLQKIIRQCEERLLMKDIHILDSHGDQITCIGDAIRWIYIWNNTSNVVKSACIVVQGNVVTNAPLKDILQQHIDRVQKARQEGSTPILTTIFTRSETDGYCVVVNDSGMVLQIQTPPILPIVTRPALKINASFLDSPAQIRVKTGLRDTRIYIGTFQFLQAFQHNFDWEYVIDDCIPQTIRNFELDNHVVYARIIPNCYSSCIDDFPDYLRASSAVLRRWLYPLTIEMNFFEAQPIESVHAIDFEEDESPDQPIEVTSYRLERDLVYLHENVFPALTAKIGHSVVIGNETKIGECCLIRNSTIGNSCRIDDNVQITNSIIWDRVVIEEGAILDHCLIASGCQIRSNIRISFGCLLSFDCYITDDLPPCRRLASYAFDEETQHFKDHQTLSWLTEYLNERKLLEIKEESGALIEILPNPAEHELPLLKLWLELNQPDFPIDPADILPSDNDLRREEEQTSTEEEQSENDEEMNDHEAVNLNEEFQTEAESLLKAMLEQEPINVDQITTEFVSLKNVQDPAHIDCAVALWIAIQNKWGKENLEIGVNMLGSLLGRFLTEADDQVDFLFWWQCQCAKLPDTNELFLHGIALMKSHGLVSGEAVTSWMDEQEDLTERQNALFELYQISESSET